MAFRKYVFADNEEYKFFSYHVFLIVMWDYYIQQVSVTSSWQIYQIAFMYRYVYWSLKDCAYCRLMIVQKFLLIKISNVFKANLGYTFHICGNFVNSFNLNHHKFVVASASN